MRLTKFIPVTSTALATTFSLFYLMEGLVASEEIVIDERPPTRIIDWVQVPDGPIEPIKMERVIPPPPVTDPPPPVDPVDDKIVTTLDPYIPVAPPIAPSDPGPRFKLVQADGERMPIVRVAPQYPSRCAARGLSGWVVLEFSVNTLGMVENPAVIDSDSSGCFNRTALKTITRFKYKPTVIDGQPRASNGVRFRMSFSLDES